MVPKWVLAVVALVVTLILAVDVGGQIWHRPRSQDPRRERVMTSPGPRGLSRAILARLGEVVRGCFAQGTVTAFTTAAPFTVTVAVPGSAAPLVVPRLKSYSPAVGEVVWLLGPPGSWVAVGALA